MSDATVAPPVFTPVRYGQYIVTDQPVSAAIDAAIAGGLDANLLLKAMLVGKTVGVIGMNLGDSAALPLIAKELSIEWAADKRSKLFKSHHDKMVELYDGYRAGLGLNDKKILVARSGDHLSVSGCTDEPFIGKWNSPETAEGDEPDPYYVSGVIRSGDGFAVNLVDRDQDNIESFVTAQAFLEEARSKWVEFMVEHDYDQDKALGLSQKIEFGIGSFAFTGKSASTRKSSSTRKERDGSDVTVSYTLHNGTTGSFTGSQAGVGRQIIDAAYAANPSMKVTKTLDKYPGDWVRHLIKSDRTPKWLAAASV